MATRRKTASRSSRGSSRSNSNLRDSRSSRSGSEREERNDRSRGGNDKSDFVNVTKLFESRKNQDILIGTVSEEYLDKLENLVADARDAGKGVTFFVMLDGKWGPNLSATLARDQQGGGRGNFDNNDSSRRNRNRRW